MTNRPTHQWCPQCGAMLPPDLEVCPRCQAKLGTDQGPAIPTRDVFKLSGIILAVALIPFVFIVLIGIICTLIFSR